MNRLYLASEVNDFIEPSQLLQRLECLFIIMEHSRINYRTRVAMPNCWHRQITPYQPSPDTPYHDKQRRNSAASTLLSDPTHISMNVEMLSRLLIVAPDVRRLCNHYQSYMSVNQDDRNLTAARSTFSARTARLGHPARTAPVSCRVAERSCVAIPSLRMRHHVAV